MRSSHPRIIVLLLLAFVTGDVLLAGPVVFWQESFGTLMLSPSVYVSLLPSGLARPLAHGLSVCPGLCFVICGLPVLMLLAALALGVAGFFRNSLRMALGASLLVATVFTVYHCVQPLGFRVLN